MIGEDLETITDRGVLSRLASVKGSMTLGSGGTTESMLSPFVDSVEGPGLRVRCLMVEGEAVDSGGVGNHR